MKRTGYVSPGEFIIGNRDTNQESWLEFIAMKDQYYAELDALKFARMGFE